MRRDVHGVPPLGRFAARDMKQTVGVGVTKAIRPKQAATVLQRKRLYKKKMTLIDGLSCGMESHWSMVFII